MKPLLLHLRMCPLRWIVVPLVCLDLAILFFRPRYWVGIWPEAGAAAQVPALFLSIIAAGAAAWTSGAVSRHRLDEQLMASAMGQARLEAYRLGSSMIYLLIPYLAGQVTAFALTARSAPPGIRMWFGYLLMGATVIVLGIAVGWIIGKYVGSGFGAFIATVSFIIVLFAFGNIAHLYVVSGPSWTEVPLGDAATRLLAVLMLTLAVLWIPGFTRRAGRGITITYVVAATAAALAIIANTSGVVDRDRPTRPLCVNGAIVMCLWPEEAKYLPVVQAVDTRVGQLPDGFALPSRLDEYGMDREVSEFGGVASTQVTGDFLLAEGSRWSLASDVSHAIVEKTLKSCDMLKIANGTDITADAIAKWTEGFLAGGGTPDYHTSGLSEKIAQAWALAAKITSTLPPDDQAAWVTQQLTSLKARYCASQ